MNIKQSSLSIWHAQLPHLVFVFILLTFSWLAWYHLGRPLVFAFWTAIAFPIVHQVLVWISWRLELRSSLTSKLVGFQVYLVVFFILFGGRFVSLTYLAWLDHGSLGLDTVLRTVITTTFLLLGIYAMYSVKRYFGMARAAGADHFDSAFRSMPLVKEGIFRFTSNAMYTYAFLLFWAIAIGFDSALALIISAFSHLYIWVHFYCTEKPDMEYIYGSSSN